MGIEHRRSLTGRSAANASVYVVTTMNLTYTPLSSSSRHPSLRPQKRNQQLSVRYLMMKETDLFICLLALPSLPPVRSTCVLRSSNMSFCSPISFPISWPNLSCRWSTEDSCSSARPDYPSESVATATNPDHLKVGSPWSLEVLDWPPLQTPDLVGES
jgi:hypothetical protein